uniref:Immunoglobulin superfamily, member 5a n=1 Tax=Amphilophus citrinellus TaxID=61819 RepID=A0A3Q0R233_AMPCI
MFIYLLRMNDVVDSSPVCENEHFSNPHISSLLYPAVSGQFQLEPVKSTVLQGSDVQFNATVGGPWQVMTWNVGGFLVLTVSKASGIIPSTDQFSARFCSQNSSCVEFTIHNVTRSHSGPVICTVQGDYGEKTAQLNVQGEFINTGLFGNCSSLIVMQDQQVKFQCGTSGWYPKPIITWTLNGNAVNSSLDNTTNDGVSFNSTSVLTFQAVRNTTVNCLASIEALTYPQSTSVFLVVGKKVLRHTSMNVCDPGNKPAKCLLCLDKRW